MNKGLEKKKATVHTSRLTFLLSDRTEKGLKTKWLQVISEPLKHWYTSNILILKRAKEQKA